MESPIRNVYLKGFHGISTFISVSFSYVARIQQERAV
jgi:hypothetical protein